MITLISKFAKLDDCKASLHTTTRTKVFYCAYCTCGYLMLQIRLLDLHKNYDTATYGFIFSLSFFPTAIPFIRSI